MPGKSKKYTYEILLTSTRIHKIDVRAASPDEACRILQRKVAGKPTQDTDIVFGVIDEIWSDPCDKEEEWIVAISGDLEHNPPTITTWNGTTINTYDAKSFFSRFFNFERRPT